MVFVRSIREVGIGASGALQRSWQIVANGSWTNAHKWKFGSTLLTFLSSKAFQWSELFVNPILTADKLVRQKWYSTSNYTVSRLHSIALGNFCDTSNAALRSWKMPPVHRIGMLLKSWKYSTPLLRCLLTAIQRGGFDSLSGGCGPPRVKWRQSRRRNRGYCTSDLRKLPLLLLLLVMGYCKELVCERNRW